MLSDEAPEVPADDSDDSTDQPEQVVEDNATAPPAEAAEVEVEEDVIEEDFDEDDFDDDFDDDFEEETDDFDYGAHELEGEHGDADSSDDKDAKEDS